jgi:hypothetical protein
MKKDNWRHQTTSGHKKEAEEVKRKYEEMIANKNKLK